MNQDILGINRTLGGLIIGSMEDMIRTCNSIVEFSKFTPNKKIYKHFFPNYLGNLASSYPIQDRILLIALICVCVCVIHSYLNQNLTCGPSLRREDVKVIQKQAKVVNKRSEEKKAS